MNLPANIQREFLQATARTGVTPELHRAAVWIKQLVALSPLHLEELLKYRYQRMDEPSTTKAQKWEVMEECEYTASNIDI